MARKKRAPLLASYLLAGFPCLYLDTVEEDRAIDGIKKAADSAVQEGEEVIPYTILSWRVTSGFTLEGGQDLGTAKSEDMKNLNTALTFVADQSKNTPTIGIFMNLRKLLEHPVAIQTLKDAINKARVNGNHIFIVGPMLQLPPELAEAVTFFDFPLPSRDQISELYTNLIGAYDGALNTTDLKESIGKAASSAVGMTLLEAENAIALSMTETNGIDIPLIQEAKEQAIKKSEVLELFRTDDTLDNVGDFDLMKAWMQKRTAVFTDTAKEYGLPNPKGVLLVGPPGCQPAGSAVVMANGDVRRIELVEEGEEVLSPQKDGTVTAEKVEKVVSYGPVPIYRIVSTGRHGSRSYLCSGNHIIPYLRLRRLSIEVGELSSSVGSRRRETTLEEERVDVIYDRGETWLKNCHARIFSSPAIPLPAQEYDVHPYVVGAFLGDGHIPRANRIGKKGGVDAPQITGTKIVLDAIQETGFVLGAYSCKYPERDFECLRAYAKQPHAELLKRTGLAGKVASDKRVPHQYMIGSIEQRLELLAGLIDTDGTASEFSSKSEGLMRDFIWLVHSVGGSASYKKRITTCNGIEFDSFRAHFSFADLQPPVRLAYKRQSDRNMSWKNPRNHGFRVEKVGEDTVYGFSMSGESKWYITNGWLVTHNTGKSLVAKAAANFLELPLVKFDIGSIFRKYVGESEGMVRKALQTIEAVAPVVVWFDELEKGFAGVSSSGSTDSGVTSRVLSTILTWMQERTCLAFSFATVNNIQGLPPEVYRAGRFDCVFSTDLPQFKGRKEIFAIHINKRGRKAAKFDLDRIAAKSVGFVGAEIEHIVEEAMFTAFFDKKREFTTEDILRELQTMRPQSVTDAERITAIREFCRTRTRPVSSDSPASADMNKGAGDSSKRQPKRKIKAKEKN